MNKIKWIAPLFVLTVMLSSCPYTSKVTIDSPAVKLNPALLGKWEPKSSSDDRYVITKDKDDEFTYKIEKKSKDQKEPTVYKAFISIVDGDSFINIWEDNSSTEKSYYFYKLELNANKDRITLTPITENITETFAKPEDLKAFIKKYKSLSFFFDKNQDVYLKD
jgi:hypothetical protein